MILVEYVRTYVLWVSSSLRGEKFVFVILFNVKFIKIKRFFLSILICSKDLTQTK
jgi:hypothetical protein